MRLVPRLTVVGLFAFVSACDADLPSGASIDEPVPLLYGARDSGSSFSMPIAIPPHNATPGFGAQPWTTVTDVNGPGVLEVVVSGTISRNKTEYPDTYGCSWGPEGGSSPVGPAGSGSWFQVSLRSVEGSIYTNKGLNVVDATTSRHLAVLDLGATMGFEVSRSGGGSTCSVAPSAGYDPLGSSQDISVDVYPFTHAVSPQSLYTGDTATFTAGVTGGFNLHNRIWKYHAGDTLTDPAGPPPGPWWANQIPGCTSSATSCDYAPTASGRFYVLPEVQDAGAHVGNAKIASEVVWVDNPHVSVNCPSSPTRGSNGACSLTGVPPSGSIAWRFSPDSLVQLPGEGAIGVGPDIQDDTSDVKDWTGQWVASGWVYYTMTTAVDTLADSTHVEVADRGWTTQQTLAAYASAYGDHPDTITTPLLGENFDPQTGVGFPDLVTTGIQFGTVEGGPNSGYIYVTAPPFTLPREYAVSQYLKSNGPIHAITAQQGVVVGTTTDWAAIDSLGGNPQNILSGVESHEMYGSGGAIGHQEAIRLALKGHPCGNLNALIDDAAGSAGTMPDRWDELEGFTEAYVWREINTHWQVSGHYTTVDVIYGVTGTASPGQAHIYGTTNDAPDDTNKSAQIQECIP